LGCKKITIVSHDEKYNEVDVSFSFKKRRVNFEMARKTYLGDSFWHDVVF